MIPSLDLRGSRFTKLVVVKRAPNVSSGAAWICRCDCGAERTVSGSNLRSGNTRSCGCLNPHYNRSVRHGATVGGKRTSEYRIWQAMWDRCYNPKSTAFARYGGRGIGICRRWQSFAAFREDMGARPPQLTLERKNNSRGYNPANCIWATRRQQANNRYTSRRLTLGGETRTVAEWSRHLGVPANRIYRRLYRGASAKEALAS